MSKSIYPSWLQEFYLMKTVRFATQKSATIGSMQQKGIELYFDKLGETDLSLYGVNKDQGQNACMLYQMGKLSMAYQLSKNFGQKCPDIKFWRL